MNNVAAALDETGGAKLESHLHPATSWQVADHPSPDGSEEVWRFTPLRTFAALLERAAELGAVTWAGELPEGVTLIDITLEEAQALAAREPVDRVAVLAVDQATQRRHLKIAAEAVVADPIVLTITGQGAQARDHWVLELGAFAQATVVLHFEGAAQYAEKLDVITGPSSQLTLISLQDWAEGSIHGGQRSIKVGRDAQVKTITVSLGGDIRLLEESLYDGPGGSIEQFGLYLVDADQHIEHRLFVDHNAPRTTSNVDYRGALQGQGAHAVWVGDVLIQHMAEGIDTYESNKNLILTEGARADSVPNLEIETGEIEGAGHSSTTGRFDDEHLFYLMSRGIDPAEAKRLVVMGFFADIIRRIGIEEIEAKLVAEVERELEALVGASAVKVGV